MRVVFDNVRFVQHGASRVILKWSPGELPDPSAVDADIGGRAREGCHGDQPGRITGRYPDNELVVLVGDNSYGDFVECCAMARVML